MTSLSKDAARPRALNDNAFDQDDDMPVFDRGRAPIPLLDRRVDLEWSPPRPAATLRGKVIYQRSDGPSIEHRLRAHEAWCTSNRYRGQAANDNQDWPLAKLLRAEGNDYLLRLAERYREVYDAANTPTELVGRDASDNIYLMSRTYLDESTGALIGKGLKRVTGRRAQPDVPATRSTPSDPDRTKKKAKPVPKRWSGDWPLLNALDCRRDLALAQAALGFLREAFEAAVVGGETLETVGREHGVGNKAGAKGAGRALVYLGLQALDEHWSRPHRRAA